jgi:hypothetical protein
MSARRLCIPLLLGGVIGPAAVGADPLAVRDQNPLIRGLYLPLPAPAAGPGDGWGAAAGLQWSNTVNTGSTRREQLLVDEETAELDLTLLRSQGPWRLRATLPVITRGPGILDGFIADWHRFFGLPQGERPLRPRNAYAIEYLSSSGVAVNAPRGTALGDLALEGGRVLAAGSGHALALWAGLEAPTGDRAHLTGNGALDAAVWLEGSADLGTRVSLAGRAGASHLGGATPLPAERTVGFGTVALSWHATSRLDGILQFDGHSGAVRGTDLAFLRDAVTLTIGGRYRLRSGSMFEAGVIEDIEVDHSPDVTFHLGWRWPAGRSSR